MKGILKKFILEEQSGFSLRRSIVKVIILAHEAIHSARKVRATRMVIKLDILKSYDLVDREFTIIVGGLNGLEAVSTHQISLF